ncbi:unnamed protein product, partial [Brassica rapa subsp. narinosa]
MKQPKWHIESMDVIVISSRKVEYFSTYDHKQLWLLGRLFSTGSGARSLLPNLMLSCELCLACIKTGREPK